MDENGPLGYRKSLDAYDSSSFSSKVDSMMLQTSGRQSYGLLAALLAGWLILLGLLMIHPGFLAAHTALVRTMPAAEAVVAQPPARYGSGLMNPSSGISVALKSFGLS